MGFRYRLILFLVVTLVAVQSLTAAFAYFYLRQSLVVRAKHELMGEMDVFTRQLQFLSERVTDAVKVSSLDYALRSAIAQHNGNTEISALRNHSRRIGAARMMLVGLDGTLEKDTALHTAAEKRFVFPALLRQAADRGEATSSVVIGDHIFWIVVVPVRAPVPIAYLVAFIPVDSALLDRLQNISARSHGILLATGTQKGAWQMGAESRTGLRLSSFHFDLPPTGATEIVQQNHHYLIVASQLPTTPPSAPVIAILSYSLDEALSPYRNIIIPLLLLLMLALATAVTGAMVIVRSVSRPIEALAASAKRIAARDYTAPPTIAQQDEIGNLAEALIAMTRAIAEREAALTHAAEEANLAREQAVRANEAKSHFLANMSHELRTPLNAIVGFSQMLEQQILGPIGVPRYTDYARDIGRSGQQLLALLEQILDVAETESNRLILAKGPVRLNDILQQTLIRLHPLADSGCVALALESQFEDLPEIEGDAARLRQAFTNVIHNAIKFTPAGGEVRVMGYAKADWLSIRIADSGVGIAAELLGHVVRPFHRLRSALDGQQQGAGLGLPFAKAVFELHGGTLDLESQPGSGTTVTIGLPVRVYHAVPTAA